MSGNNELQKMYEYKEMKDNASGQEYVVRGAEVFCGYGSQSCVLNLPKDHGIYTSDGRPLITVSDTKPRNIRSFGICSADRKHPCECKPELGAWEQYGSPDMKINREYAVKRNATVTCKKGGIIILSTSGQTTPDFNSSPKKGAVEIKEDMKSSWSKSEGGKDFLGHIKVNRSGIYNFGISVGKNVNLFTEGSIFLYQSSFGKLKYTGTYTLKKHTQNKSGLYDWVYWAEIVLSQREDYCIEIDIPSIDSFEYKLVGNVEEVNYTGRIITQKNEEGDDVPYSGGMYWSLDQEIELLSQKVYEVSAVARFVMYLDCDYVTAIYDLICSAYMESNTDNKKVMQSVAVSVLKLIPITAVGIANAPAGVIVSVVDILVTGFSQTDAMRLAKTMKKYVDQKRSMRLSIVVVHPTTIEDNYFELEDPHSRVEEYEWEVQDWDSKTNDKVQGEKYFKGKFNDMKKISYIYNKEVAMRNLEDVITVLPSE